MKEFEKSWGAVEPEYVTELKSETALLNIRRTRLFLESLLVLQLVTYVILLMVSQVSEFYEFQYNHSLGLFFALLLFSIVDYFIVVRLDRLFLTRHITTKAISINTWITVGFFTSWSALLSVNSVAGNPMHHLFLLSLMITAFIFYIDKEPEAVIFSVSIGIYLFGHLWLSDKVLVAMDYLNLGVFSMLAWVMSRMNYQSYIDFYRNKCVINDKNKLLQEINEDLTTEVIEKQEILRALETANATLRKISAIDELTSVPNRRKLNEVVTYEWRRSQRERNDIAIFMMDIDNFKLYNDTYGHGAGDVVLRQVATVLNQFSMRPTDFFARYGGEEFTFLAINMDRENILHFANRMRASVEGLKIVNDGLEDNGVVTVSIGATLAKPYCDDSIQGAFDRADMGLYMGKRDGKNTMRFVDIDDKEPCEMRG